MSKFTKVCLTLVLAITLFVPVTPVHAADLTVCDTGCDHTTIQAAVNAASDGNTISVGAGTYVENVTINKPLTLQGAQFDVDTSGRTAADTNESTIQGLVTISASNVSLNGFSLTNPGQSFAVYVPTATPSHSVINIAYNMVDTVGGTSFGSVVHAVYINRGADSVTIANNSFNNIKALDKSVSAIGILDSASTNSSEGLVIEDNTFSDIASIAGSNQRGAYGIIINNAIGAPSAQILNNAFSNLNGLWTHAIGLEGPTLNASVIGNAFSNLTATNAADNAAIFFEKNPVGDTVTLVNNEFNGSGFYGILIHANDLPGGTNGYNYTVNGEQNWWSSDSGPGNPGPGTGALVGSNVEYSPWLMEVPGTSPMVWGTNDSIQEAIDASANGDTIMVSAGSYAENVVVNKVVTLDGAGSESDDTSNTIITGSDTGVGLTLSAGTDTNQRVIVKDLRVVDFSTGVVANSFNTLENVTSISNTLYGINLSPLEDLVITNSKFNNNDVGLKIASTASVDNVTISYSEFNGNANHGWYSDKGSGSGSTITNLDISYTTFNDNVNKGFYTEKLSDAVFDHITINNSGTGGATNHRAGMDINLKYGSYANIQILNSTITNNGTGDPNGGGLLIKARSTGSYAGNPATLDGVTLTNLVVTGNGGGTYGAGIRIGESHNSFTGIDAGPTNVTISDSEFSGNGAHAVRNATTGTTVMAEDNWWGNTNGPEDSTGTVELPFTPEPAVADMLNSDPSGDLGAKVGENVDYYPWDMLPIVVSITRASDNPTSAASVDFTVTFSEDVQNVDTDDFDLVPSSGITGASISSVTPVSASVYTVTVNTGSGSGTLRLDVPDTATIQDLSDFDLSGLPFESGEVYTKVVTLTVRSNGTNDGWILESTETSTTGGTMNSSATTLILGDDASDRQYRIILHFDTATLPDNAVITSAVLKLREQGVSGDNPFTILGALRADMRVPNFGAPALQLTDFATPAARNNSVVFSTTPVNSWYSGTIKNARLNYINLTGSTQFKLYFSMDDNNDNSADVIRFFSGDAPITRNPRLVIKYYIP